MPIRHNRQTQTGGSASGGRSEIGQHARRAPGERRHAWTRLSAVLLALVLVLAALLGPAAQARPATERSPEEETLAASKKAAKAAELEERAAAKKAEQEERAAAKKAQREERAAAKKAQRERERGASTKTPKTPKEHQAILEKSPGGKFNGAVKFACNEVEWTFMNFPKGENTVIEELTFNHEHATRTHSTFSFDGPTATATTTIVDPRPGHYTIDARANWKGNGVRGDFDIRGGVNCLPAFSVEKLQEIQGGGGSYTSSPLTGQVGQTVDYEIIVKNTNDDPLKQLEFSDKNCDPGTISGGPGRTPLAAGASTTYTCTHVLDEADRSAGSYSNTATVTGTPREREGSPVTHTSNTVVVKVPAPAFSIEKLQKIEGAAGSYTSSQLTGQVGQTVDYEIIVKNTGNVPLTLGEFTDPHCDAGTIAGGPGGALAVDASTTYTCTHLLDEADRSAGSYSNTATVTGTPPEGEGSPVTHTSNTVVVKVPAPGLSVEKLQKIEGGGGSTRPRS